MLAFEHYIMLADKLNDAERIGTPVEVTLEQIADALHCTPRNAKLVLRRLKEDGLIEWQAGRGRGNRSRLSFMASKENVLLEMTRQYADKEDYKQAFDLLQRYGSGTQAADKFTDWLSGSFGFAKEQGEDNVVKDTLRLPLSKAILTLDPAECLYSLDGHMTQQFFDKLVRYDDEADRILPQLSHAWESNAEATEWTFHLRKGILFHNGKELKAEDVIFTFNRIRSGKRNSWLLRSLIAAEAVTERAVRFRLIKPNRIFPRFLCSISLSILPANFAGQDEAAFWKHPVGTGPFQMEEWTDERFVMNANTRYYQGRPHLDSVILVFMPSSAPSQALWQQQFLGPGGELEEVPQEEWQRTDSGHCCTSLLTWNMNKEGVHQSEPFRRAVDLLIDRRRMIDELGERRFQGAKGYFREEQDQPKEGEGELNQEAAKLLLLQDNYGGTPITIGTYGHHSRDAEWIQQQCASAGIAVQIRYEHHENIQHASVRKDMDAILHALVFPEKEVCMIENYEQDGSFVKEYQTADWQAWISEQIDSALACEHREDRLSLLSVIENRLKQASHLSFLLHSTFQRFSSPSYKGIGTNSHGWIDFKDIWMP
ncbi:ABC transporter substrate-binding protein [Paenibacillus sp. NEAU-GSW1]|uniref:ABC transporter substrate-binding protein n=1 Tax=Paenibacillus sp. NEAU-GSW1 TaxID=2682486 RepID=UPI0012E1A006|nr:ABC transporter substrate-binding protein [Paenibacillus sp. NEAU-GSW1]MUT65713.1 ABC transporter substrate-binding protein [Paenibacillus sp. NEAU-GSW1]